MWCSSQRILASHMHACNRCRDIRRSSIVSQKPRSQKLLCNCRSCALLLSECSTVAVASRCTLLYRLKVEVGRALPCGATPCQKCAEHCHIYTCIYVDHGLCQTVSGTRSMPRYYGGLSLQARIDSGLWRQADSAPTFLCPHHIVPAPRIVSADGS